MRNLMLLLVALLVGCGGNAKKEERWISADALYAEQLPAPRQTIWYEGKECYIMEIRTPITPKEIERTTVRRNRHDVIGYHICTLKEVESGDVITILWEISRGTNIN